MSATFKLVVLISGQGTNLKAILEQIQAGHLQAEVAAVISNRPQAPGLTLAQQAGIHTAVLDHTQFDDRLSFDQALMDLIDQHQPDLIVLAGFMRILSESFVHHFLGKLINIHPSLLPKYQGLHTHQRALADKQTEHGASVHFVIPELDSGPVILQAAVPIYADDDVGRLQQRVQVAEHQLYPEAIRRLVAGQVSFSNGMVYYGEQPISTQQQQFEVTLNTT